MEFLKKVENKVRNIVGGAFIVIGGFTFTAGAIVLPPKTLNSLSNAADYVLNMLNSSMELATEESSEEEETEE